MTTSTIKTYVSDGTSTIYTFDCDYLVKSFMKVSVEGQAVDFTLSGTYQITLTTAAPVGDVIIIKRETSRDTLVTFVDGSVLLADDLNVAALQATHIAAEALDATGASLILGADGAYSASSRRITDVGDPATDNDVVNKGWITTNVAGELAQTIAAKDIAIASKAAAALSEIAAAASATASEASNVAAAGEASTATTKAAEAAISASTATSKAAEATADAVSADADATTATAKAAEAAASALEAATFDPAAYVSLVGGGVVTGTITHQGSAPAFWMDPTGVTDRPWKTILWTDKIYYQSFDPDGVNGLKTEFTFSADGALDSAVDVVRRSAGDIRYAKNGLLANDAAFYQNNMNDLGDKSAAHTLAFTDGNLQKVTNVGTWTLTAPTTYAGSLCLLLQNGVGSGVVTLSGFSRVTGDDLTAVDNEEFLLYVTRLDGFEHCHVVALQ